MRAVRYCSLYYFDNLKKILPKNIKQNTRIRQNKTAEKYKINFRKKGE
nr:MAG TPA: hypothetical protein [Caudoviricetes sp.]